MLIDCYDMQYESKGDPAYRYAIRPIPICLVESKLALQIVFKLESHYGSYACHQWLHEGPNIKQRHVTCFTLDVAIHELLGLTK